MKKQKQAVSMLAFVLLIAVFFLVPREAKCFMFATLSPNEAYFNSPGEVQTFYWFTTSNTQTVTSVETDSPFFHVVNNGCIGMSGGGCYFDVMVDPDTPPLSYGTVTIYLDPPPTGPSAKLFYQSRLLTDSSSLLFDSANTTQTVNVSNPTSGAFIVSSITSDNTYYSILNDTCTGTGQISSCSFDVKLNPTNDAQHGLISISYRNTVTDELATITIDATYSTTTDITTSIPSVVLNSPGRSKSVHVSNLSGVNIISVTTDNPSFRITGDTCTNHNTDCSFTVILNPTSLTDQSGNIVISYETNDNSVNRITIPASFVVDPDLVDAPAPCAFSQNVDLSNIIPRPIKRAFVTLLKFGKCR